MRIRINALKDYLPLILERKKLFFTISGLIFVLGLLYIIFLPAEWTAKSKVLYVYEGESSSISGPSLIQGLNLGTGNSMGISPLVFDDITYSRESLNAILDLEIKKAGQVKKIKDFLQDDYSVNFIGRASQLFSGIYSRVLGGILSSENEVNSQGSSEDIYAVYRQTRNERKLHGILKRSISVTYFDQTNLVEISCSFQSKEATVTIVNHLVEYLNKYIANFKNAKLISKELYLSKQLEMVSLQLDSTQYTYAKYQERNRGIVAAREIFRKTQFESDYQRIFSAYVDIQKQLQATKVSMAVTAPAFFVINAPSIPLKKSSTGRLSLLIFFTVFSVFFSSCIVILYQILIKKD